MAISLAIVKIPLTIDIIYKANILLLGREWFRLASCSWWCGYWVWLWGWSRLYKGWAGEWRSIYIYIYITATKVLNLSFVIYIYWLIFF